MQDSFGKKLWIYFQKNIKFLFFIFLGVLAAADFFIHRHHHFKIGEFHLFEAFAGMIFIFLLVLFSNILKAVFFKPENFYNDK